MINIIKKHKKNNSFSEAFTIIELIIVIIVIGILATISAVSYVGIKDKTIESTIKSQLTSAADDLKEFRNKNGNYPATIDCSIADSGINLCLEPGDDVSYTYLVDDESNPQTFTLYATSLTNGKIYSITYSSTVSEVTKIPEPAGWKQISDGYHHTCAITSDNQAYCWGWNAYGQLGNNSTTNSLVPVAVDTSGVLSGKTIESIDAGYYHTCVIASDNQAYCWGRNNYGQLGNNSTTDSSIPVAVDTSGMLSGKTIESISVGRFDVCVIASDNQAYCWGRNNYGQLGNNSTTDSSIPVAVDTSGVLSGKTIESISAGYYHTCVIASDNQAYCWGYNNVGQLGNNSTTNSIIPVAVYNSGVFSGKTIEAISTGGFLHTCAIASDSQVYCWGYNSNGQLGNNSKTDSVVPVSVNTAGVLSGKTIKSINTGTSSTCVIASDNLAYCWGSDQYGKLGDGNTADALVPIAINGSDVLSDKTIKSIDINSFGHTCLVASNNLIYCWGRNNYGQLGNNSTTDSLVPVQVLSPSS